MDPENLRTIVTGLVTVTVGVVPAVLLYRQNRESADRELKSRAADRAADEKRQQLALAKERARAQMQLDETARQELRQRFVRFLHAVRHATDVSDNALRLRSIPSLSPSAASELAGSAEDLLIDGGQIAVHVDWVRTALDRLLTLGADEESDTKIAEARAHLRGQMANLRAEMSRELQHASSGYVLEWLDEDIESAMGQEPTTP